MGSKMNLWKVRDFYLKKMNWRRSDINKENLYTRLNGKVPSHPYALIFLNI